MKQPSDRLIFRKLVVELRGLGRSEDVRFDLPLLQELQGFARNLETFRHPPREHHDLGTMVQEFLHVGGLNTRHVLCVCLAPVPIPRTAGKKLRVLVRLGLSFDLKPTPRGVRDLRRTLLILHKKTSFVRYEAANTPDRSAWGLEFE